MADSETTVWDDPRVASIDGDARYQDDFSDDGGRTWQPNDRDTVCGGHVQIETVWAIRAGRDIVVDGPIRTLTEYDGRLVRWTPVR